MEKEKKEIWIEKLIELLCEYLWEEYHWEYFEWYRDIEIPQRLDSLSELKPFIKWLVENDKINLEKVKINWLNYVNDEILENKILMLLSISDTPIEDLCGYLKDDATEEVDTLLKGIKKSCESLWL